MSENVGFAGQITPEQVAQVAEKGFKSIINNRPDMEGGAEQPTSAQIEDAARNAGLDYVFQPRSEERRVGKECRIGCRSRWSPYH